MTVIAGIDVGNATTEVVLVSGGKILGAGRAPTRGRKGSPGSLRGAAALVRRLERQFGCTVTRGADRAAAGGGHRGGERARRGGAGRPAAGAGGGRAHPRRNRGLRRRAPVPR